MGRNEFELYPKIKAGNYDMPADLDDDVKDLVKDLLKLNPLERLGFR